MAKRTTELFSVEKNKISCLNQPILTSRKLGSKTKLMFFAEKNGIVIRSLFFYVRKKITQEKQIVRK